MIDELTLKRSPFETSSGADAERTFLIDVRRVVALLSFHE